MKAGVVLQPIRIFLVSETAVFVVAALVHSGSLVDGYEHTEARTAESVIALVLFIGLMLSWVRPSWTRKAGLAAQGFALLGTLIGVCTIIVGVGPRTMPDIAYHVAIVAVLVWGVDCRKAAKPAAMSTERKRNDAIHDDVQIRQEHKARVPLATDKTVKTKISRADVASSSQRGPTNHSSALPRPLNSGVTPQSTAKEKEARLKGGSMNTNLALINTTTVGALGRPTSNWTPR